MLQIKELERPMTKEESYVQRRQLFKDIWETALAVNEKEDILTKPKVIKTLRMDEIDKCPVGHSKKQRIKNLRHVCKRILDFCDRQDAEDKYLDRTEADPQEAAMKEWRGKKLKSKRKKKVVTVKSLINPSRAQIKVARVSISERNHVLKSPNESGTGSVNCKPTLKRRVVKKKLLKHKPTKNADFPNEIHQRKVKKRRVLKKKKTTAATSRTPQVMNY